MTSNRLPARFCVTAWCRRRMLREGVWIDSWIRFCTGSQSRGIEANTAVWPWLLALAVICYVGGAATDWPLMQHIAYALAGLNLLGLIIVRTGSRGLKVSASTDRARLTAGEAIKETYLFEKRSMWPAAWIELEHDSGTLGAESTGLSLLGGSRQSISRHRTLGRRGQYALATGTVRVRDPFGLFTLTKAELAPTHVTVYPRAIEIPEAVEAARALSAGHHRWRSESADATHGDLREYVSGDPPSRIHWRSTARRGTLMVTDPESQRRQSIWLLVDLGGDPDAAETAAGIGAYLAEKLWRSGQAVGAVVAGEEVLVVPARRGREQAGYILGALATVDTSARSEVDRLVRALPRSDDLTTLVFISPAVRREPCSGYGPPASDPCRKLGAVFPGVTIIPLSAQRQQGK